MLCDEDLVGGDPIRCAKSVLELLFDEQQLLIVYRMAMEIDAALAGDDDIQHPPPQLPYQTLPLQGPNNHAHRVMPLHPLNYGTFCSYHITLCYFCLIRIFILNLIIFIKIHICSSVIRLLYNSQIITFNVTNDSFFPSAL